MQHINDVFDLDGLDLLTADEKEFNKMHVQALKDYAVGKASGVQIRMLTAGASAIARRQQSRSAVAMLKWNMALKASEARPALEERRENTVVHGGTSHNRPKPTLQKSIR